MSKPCNGMWPRAARPLKSSLTDGKRVWREAYEKLKARVRAYVEHPFHVVKNLFHYKKTRYKGLVKNDAQLNALFALSNLYMVRGELRP